MSLRQYRPRARSRRLLSGKMALTLNLLLVLSIALQMSYPLIHGSALTIVTVLTVYFGAATMIIHSHFAFGLRGIALYAFAYRNGQLVIYHKAPDGSAG
jgi:hypothetical protein